MNAKQKAIKFLEKECKSSYIDVNRFEHYSTNNISMALDIAIKEQTKQIFEFMDVLIGYKLLKDRQKRLDELKEEFKVDVNGKSKMH